MAMSASYIAAVAAAGAGLITHIGLVNGAGVEISGGSYARKPVTWTGAAGVKNPTADLLFDIPAGATVAGWRAFTALTGGTNHGGAALTPAAYTNAGTYNLLAASTNITHAAI